VGAVAGAAAAGVKQRQLHAHRLQVSQLLPQPVHFRLCLLQPLCGSGIAAAAICAHPQGQLHGLLPHRGALQRQQLCAQLAAVLLRVCQLSLHLRQLSRAWALLPLLSSLAVADCQLQADRLRLPQLRRQPPAVSICLLQRLLQIRQLPQLLQGCLLLLLRRRQLLLQLLHLLRVAGSHSPRIMPLLPSIQLSLQHPLLLRRSLRTLLQSHRLLQPLLQLACLLLRLPQPLLNLNSSGLYGSSSRGGAKLCLQRRWHWQLFCICCSCC
jgi:hypothetical protein